MNFTGEYYVPGKSPKRIEEDHIARYKFASKYVKNKNVLDIACGTGYGSFKMAQAGASSVVGVDISRELIGFSKNNYKFTNLSFINDDILTFISDYKFDVIVCFETIEHIKNYINALRNLHNLLKNNGTLIISTPNRLVTSPTSTTINEKPENAYHEVEFTMGEFRSVLITTGFAVEYENIFGQRQRTYIRNKYLRAIHSRIFNPDERADFSVKPLETLFFIKKIPRYFVFIATKQH